MLTAGSCMQRYNAGLYSMFSRLFISAFALLFVATHPARAEWTPVRPVEFIVLAAANGSSDKAVRLLTDIIRKHNLAPISFSVLNKADRSGAEGFEYFIKHPDVDHTLVFSSTAFYTLPLRHPELGADISLFAPIAAMGADVMMLWVPGGRRDITSLDDFVNAVREKKKRTGQDWVMAGFGEESVDTLLTKFLSVNYQIEMKHLACASGGEAAKRMVEGQADATIGPVSVHLDYYKAGKSKPLVNFSGERFKEFADVPTLIESGVKFSLEAHRSISGPQGMSNEARDFYAALFKKAFDTPEWQNYRTQNVLRGDFLTGPDLRASMLRQLKMHRIMISFIDMMKGGAASAGAGGSHP